MKTILCFGDSLTFGEKDLEEGGWTERLRKYYLNSEKVLPYQSTLVYNLGIASETSDGLVARLESEIRARRIGKQNLIVVMSYGLNDIRIHKDKNIVPIEFFKRNFTRALDFVSSLKGQAIIVNLPPLNKKLDGVKDLQGNTRFLQDISVYNELLKQISDENDVDLIDVHSSLEQHKDIYASDLLHLNEQGHELIFRALLDKLNN